MSLEIVFALAVPVGILMFVLTEIVRYNRNKDKHTKL